MSSLRTEYRVIFYKLMMLFSPDIADHAGEHQHRSPPSPRLHSPRAVTPPQGWLRPAGQQLPQPRWGHSAGGSRALRRCEVSPCQPPVSVPTPRGAGLAHSPLLACLILGLSMLPTGRCPQPQRPAPAAAPRIPAAAAAAPALPRGRRFTRGWINPNALFIRPRINSHPK